MDPNETLRQLLALLADDDHDREEASYLRDALVSWLRKGGFPPDHAFVVDYMAAALLEVSKLPPHLSRPPWVWADVRLALTLYEHINEEG